MSTELSDKEANELFMEISGALKDNNASKLGELFVNPDVEDEQEPANDGIDPASSQDEDEPEGEIEGEEADNGDNSDDEASPPEGADGNPADEDGDDALAKLRTQIEELKREKEKTDREIHHFRSQAGRMKAVSRDMKKYDERLEELQRQIASPSNRPSAAVLGKVKEKFKSIEDIDPELASLLENALGEALVGIETDNLSRERDTVTLLRQREIEEYEEAEASRLLQMFPNAAEVFNSPAWKEWKQEQPKGIAALAESSSADEVATAFRLYSDAMLAKYPDLTKSAGGKQEQPAAKQPDPKATQIEAERKRKREGAANVSSPSAQGKVGLPDDPNALFNKYYEQIRKERYGS